MLKLKEASVQKVGHKILAVAINVILARHVGELSLFIDGAESTQCGWEHQDGGHTRVHERS